MLYLISLHGDVGSQPVTMNTERSATVTTVNLPHQCRDHLWHKQHQTGWKLPTILLSFCFLLQQLLGYCSLFYMCVCVDTGQHTQNNSLSQNEHLLYNVSSAASKNKIHIVTHSHLKQKSPQPCLFFVLQFGGLPSLDACFVQCLTVVFVDGEPGIWMGKLNDAQTGVAQC